MKNWVWLLFSILILAGCADRHEIEEEAFVIAIGLDDPDNGKGLSVTYQIANPQAGIANTGGEKEVASEIITFTAPDFITARDLANATVSRKVDFSHTKVMIVGEELAKKEKGVKYIIAGIRDREIRRELKLIVSKEKASDFIRNNNPKLETRPHKYFDLMTGRWEETGLVPFSTLRRFLEKYESGADAQLSIYATTEQYQDQQTKGEEDEYYSGQIAQEGGNTTQLIGSAVFKKGVMIGKLTGEETRLALLLRPHAIAKYMKVTYKDPIDPEYRVSAQLNKHKATEIKVLTDKEPVEINVTIPLDYEILSIPSGVNYVTNKKNQELLRNDIEKQLNKKFQDLIKKAQENYKTNPFNWSHITRRQFWTLQEYDKYSWEEKFINAKVNLKVKVHFTGFGQLTSPMESEKKE